MGVFFRRAFARRITNSVRVAWIAAIVFFIPLLARGITPTLQAGVAPLASALETCHKDANQAATGKQDPELKQIREVGSFCGKRHGEIQTHISGVTGVEEAWKKATASEMPSKEAGLTELLANCKAVNDKGGAGELGSGKMMTDMSSNYNQAASQLNGMPGCSKVASCQKAAQALGTFAGLCQGEATEHTKVFTLTSDFGTKCTEAQAKLGPMQKANAEAKEAMASNQQMMQMGQMGLGALGQAMDLMAKGKSSGAAAGGPTSLDAGPGGLGDIGNGLNLPDGGLGGVDSDGDGIPDSQEKNGVDIAGPEIGNGIGLSTAGDPAAAPALGATASSGAAYVPSALSDSSLTSSSPVEENSTGGRSPASTDSGGGSTGSGSLSGGKSTTMAGETAATNSGASKEGDGSDRSGGGKGLAGGIGGGGSSLLGLGGDSGLDLLSGFKNPLEAASEASGDGSLRLGGGAEPPPADPRRLASAVEIDTRTMEKDSVFSVVKNAIQRQRERGNTR